MSEVTTPSVDLTKYNALDEQLAEYQKINGKLVFNYEDKKDNKNARSHLAKLRSFRAEVGRIHKALKADILEAGREVDKVKKQYESKITAMIEVHEKPIKAIEQKEKDRVARFQKFKDDLVEMADVGNLDLLGYAENLALVDGWDIKSLELGSDHDEAMSLWEATLSGMNIKFESIQEQERKDAELAKLQAEKAERDRQDQIKAEAQRLAEQEKAAAEQRAADAEARAKRAEEDKQREVERVKREAEDKAERERRARQLEEDRRIAQVRADQQRLEQNKAAREYTLRAIEDDIATKTGIGMESAIKVARALIDGRIEYASVRIVDPVAEL